MQKKLFQLKKYQLFEEFVRDYDNKLIDNIDPYMRNKKLYMLFVWNLNEKQAIMSPSKRAFVSDTSKEKNKEIKLK